MIYVYVARLSSLGSRSNLLTAFVGHRTVVKPPFATHAE